MKKYFLGFFAFIFSLIFVAFTNLSNKTKNATCYYYFIVNGCHSSTSAVSNTDAYFLSYSCSGPPLCPAWCNGGNCQCISGFTADQVRPKPVAFEEYELIDDGPGQVPAITPCKKNN